MKNILYAAVCAGLLIVVSGCKGRTPLNPLGCATNAEKFVEVANRFAQNPTKANCEAYKKEIVAFIKSCPTYYGAVEKKDLEDFANQPCEE